MGSPNYIPPSPPRIFIAPQPNLSKPAPKQPVVSPTLLPKSPPLHAGQKMLPSQIAAAQAARTKSGQTDQTSPAVQHVSLAASNVLKPPASSTVSKVPPPVPPRTVSIPKSPAVAAPVSVVRPPVEQPISAKGAPITTQASPSKAPKIAESTFTPEDQKMFKREIIEKAFGLLRELLKNADEDLYNKNPTTSADIYIGGRVVEGQRAAIFAINKNLIEGIKESDFNSKFQLMIKKEGGLDLFKFVLFNLVELVFKNSEYCTSMIYSYEVNLKSTKCGDSNLDFKLTKDELYKSEILRGFSFKVVNNLLKTQPNKISLVFGTNKS